MLPAVLVILISPKFSIREALFNMLEGLLFDPNFALVIGFAPFHDINLLLRFFVPDGFDPLGLVESLLAILLGMWSFLGRSLFLLSFFQFLFSCILGSSFFQFLSFCFFVRSVLQKFFFFSFFGSSLVFLSLFFCILLGLTFFGL